MLSFQLYRPVGLGSWLTLHQLYALAERQGLATLPISDGNGQARTVTGTYLSSLVMGCIKPNQLRQSDMVAVHAALDQWSDRLQIGSQDAIDGLFLVDLDSDQPPLYSALYGKQGGSQCRLVRTQELVNYLRELQELDDAKGKPGIKLEDGLVYPPICSVTSLTASAV